MTSKNKAEKQRLNILSLGSSTLKHVESARSFLWAAVILQAATLIVAVGVAAFITTALPTADDVQKLKTEQENFMRSYKTAAAAAAVAASMVAASEPAKADCVEVGRGSSGQAIYRCDPPPKPQAAPPRVCETVDGVLVCNYKPDVTPPPKPAPRVPANCGWSKKGVYVCR